MRSSAIDEGGGISDRAYILGIETSNPSSGGGLGGVALGRVDRDGRLWVIGFQALRASASRGGHDDDLMPAIERLFADAGARPQQLSRVGVSNGPGGFTGLRVACATGKMIAEAAGCACVAVESARVVMASLLRERKFVETEGGVAVALASKGDSAWVDVFGRSGERLSDWSSGVRTAFDIPALAALGVRTLVSDQFLPAVMRAAADAAGMQVVPPIFDARAVVELAAVGAPVDPTMLNPLYPREPEAVTLWRKRANA